MDMVFRHEYESIKALEVSGSFSNLVVLTGKNGSGKSHLLNAIRDGAIEVVKEGRIIPRDRIVHVPFGGLTVTGGDTYSSQQAQDLANQMWGNFIGWRQNYINQNQNTHDKERFIAYLSNYRNVNDINSVRQVAAITHTLRNEPSLNIQQIYPQHFWKHLFDPTTATTTVDFFEQNFAKIFAEYQISLVKQRFYKYMRGKGYMNAPSVSTAALRELEDNKPWDFVNEVLRAAKFDFEILPPDFWDTEQFNYTIKLKKLSTGAEVEFGKLSTGEQVLFALALVRYKAEKRLTNFPELILLDEPDAPLHPAMTSNLIDVLKDVFVVRYNTSIFTSTHSPATVALAPEGSVVLVDPKNNPNRTSVSHVEKNDALDTLTSGYVAVSTEENQARLTIEVKAVRKPVLLVEGKSDVKIIEEAWKKLKPQTTIPFVVVNCGAATQIHHKLNATTVEDIDDKKIFGLFDFDDAYNEFNGLKSHLYDSVSGTEETCLFKKRTSSRQPIYGLLLPVPIHRAGYANRTLKSESKLPIELMFDDEVLDSAGYLTEIIQAGGSTIKQFQGNKINFANDIVPNLNAEDFTSFIPLFDFIINVIENE